ncbi:MAG: class I SAM-dependent methyltransferase [Acidimicrobiales bacterium]|nr:class I SAM-dependent methyltransferase [Acidimicrobiales bacterium]
MDDDRTRWDLRWSDRPILDPTPPALLAAHLDLVPGSGRAIDLACGQGAHAVWLALRGLDVVGVDVSPVAIERANALAASHGVSGRCRFVLADLDDGLPPEAQGSFDLVLCQRFRDRRLYAAMQALVAPGGVLAVTVLSRVDRPGATSSFLADPGETIEIAGDLDVIARTEADGEASVLARRPGTHG